MRVHSYDDSCLFIHVYECLNYVCAWAYFEGLRAQTPPPTIRYVTVAKLKMDFKNTTKIIGY